MYRGPKDACIFWRFPLLTPRSQESYFHRRGGDRNARQPVALLQSSPGCYPGESPSKLKEQGRQDIIDDMESSAYQNGLQLAQVQEVVGIKLRDEILKIRGLE